eukprot:gene16070-17693_t
MAQSDWDSVTYLKKKPMNAKEARSQQAINAAMRKGTGVDTERKFTAATNKQHTASRDTAKLERETEELQHAHVSLEVGKLIQKIRMEREMTQKELATKINEKPQVINDYEAGRAIPNNQIMNKLERALGVCATRIFNTMDGVKCSKPKISLHSGYFHETLRAWQSQPTNITSDNFMYPLFISYEDDAKEEIPSLPHQYRLGVNRLEEFVAPLIDDGLKSVLLFPVIEEKFKNDQATNVNSPSANKALKAVELLKEKFPSLLVACDVCLCAFTSHGHCGLILPQNQLINESDTNEKLVQLAAAYISHGADMVAPSDMMDGRIAAITQFCDASLYRGKVAVMSYSAKFASCFYGPFRDAAGSAPQFGDRQRYQLPPGARGLALRAARRDIREGADIVMVKPGMPYLDIVQQIKQEFPEYPVAVYQVSGEYAMLYHSSTAGIIELEKALQETITCMRRAGADIIITYFTPFILKMLKKSNNGK